MNDPYVAPTPAQPESGMPILEPKAIKVFGVLHLVFGIVGVLGIIWGIANFFLGDMMAKLSAAGDEQMFEMQKGMQEELKVPTIIALILSVVVTTLILIAAAKLLKNKKDAVKASAAYTFASVAAKVIGLILAFTYTIPALNRYFDELTAEISSGPGGSAAASMMEFTKMTTAATGVVSPLLMSIYPILSLVLF